MVNLANLLINRAKKLNSAKKEATDDEIREKIHDEQQILNETANIMYAEVF
jgi:hypothetical protein